MKLLVTGGAGFIGSNFVQYFLREHADDSLVVLDKLTYAGNLRNLEPVSSDSRFRFVRMDVCDPAVADVVTACNAVIHFAAESHVDRSIESSAAFIQTNVEGSRNLMDCCRRAGISRFVTVSTDEVYGSLGSEGRFTESTPLAPNSPYSASKAAADLLALAYVRTHRFPAIITRCSNNYGPYQFPEKFLPLMIAQAMAGKKLPVYGDGMNVRDWIHVEDHCRALDLVLRQGRVGEVYNIGGNSELPNLEVVHRLLRALGRDENLIEFVQDRPGHDRRYAIDSSKIEQELGWKRRWNFTDGLAATIQWYRDNQPWLEETRSGAYRDYFDKHYTRRTETFSTAG